MQENFENHTVDNRAFVGIFVPLNLLNIRKYNYDFSIIRHHELLEILRTTVDAYPGVDAER